MENKMRQEKWDAEVDSEILTFSIQISFSEYGAAIDAEYDVEKIDPEYPGNGLIWAMGGWLHFTNNVVVDYTLNDNLVNANLPVDQDACLDIVSRKIEELGLGGFWYKSNDNASE